MSIPKIQVTKNYRMFFRSDDNRPTDLKKHKNLIESMKKHGFIKTKPIEVIRNEKGQLIVKDGQHRLAIAESLGLPVYWVEADVDFDIAEVNRTPKLWVLSDYAQRFAACGKAAYQEGIEFAKEHKLPIGTAFALLAGTVSLGNLKESFFSGDFKIKDRQWADAVANIYVPITSISSAVKGARLIEACMAVCRVKTFDAKRLIAGAERCREKLVPYSTRDAYLAMLEDIYNFGRHNLVALKIEAETAMRERNVRGKRKKVPATA